MKSYSRIRALHVRPNKICDTPASRGACSSPGMAGLWHIVEMLGGRLRGSRVPSGAARVEVAVVLVVEEEPNFVARRAPRQANAWER